MGKIRKSRFLSKKKDNCENLDGLPSVASEGMDTAPVDADKQRLTSGENIFEGVDIDVSKITNSIEIDDAKSIHSIPRTLKSLKRSGRHMTKDEKRKIRNELFLTQLNKFYAKKEKLNSMKRGRKMNSLEPNGLDVSIKELDAACPPVQMLFHNQGPKAKGSRPVSTKQKGIKKAQVRVKIMNNNVNALKEMMQSVKKKPLTYLDEITDHIQEVVMNDKF